MIASAAAAGPTRPPSRSSRRRRLALRLASACCGVLVFLVLQGCAHWQGSSSLVRVGAGGQGGALLGRTRVPHGSRGLVQVAEPEAGARLGSGSAARDQWAVAPGGTLSATEAASVEAALDAAPAVGLCEGGQPLLPGTPAHVCQRRACLWSHTLQTNVELGQSELQVLPLGTRQQACPIAQGGQTGAALAGGEPPLVSFVFLAGTDDELAMQGLIQLFRTAHEAPSAEFILVEAAWPGGTGPALQYPQLRGVASQLSSFFGTQLRLLNSTEMGSSHGEAPGSSGGERQLLQQQQQLATVWMEAQEGLSAANGTFVVLVLASTFVLRGWLHALLATLAAHPRAAMVGPLVLAHGGLVAEAGGTLWADGSLTMPGAGASLELAQEAGLLHLRQVDFVGGACMALRREAVLEAGGFDAHFHSYFGAADLALALQQQGQHVLLQPLSLVLARQPSHSAGGGRAGQLQHERDALLFAAKWQQVLHQQYCPPPAATAGQLTAAQVQAAGELQQEQLDWAYSGRKAGPHLMWIDDTVPTPDKDSGSVRLMGLLRILLEEGYRVSFQPRRNADRAYNLALAAAGVRVLPAEPLVLRSSGQTLATSGGGGGCLYDGFVVARRGNYNRTYQLLDEACPGVPQVFDTVDLHFLREARAELSKRGLGAQTGASDLVEWLRSAAPTLAAQSAAVASLLQRQERELGLIRHASATLVVSEEELQVLRQFLPADEAGRVFLVSNIHELPSTPSSIEPATSGLAASLSAGAGDGPVSAPRPCEARQGILFVGNYNHRPNVDAAVWLVKHVLPRVRQKLPPAVAAQLQVHVVGSGALPPDARELLQQHPKAVRLHGYLPEDLLRMLYASVKVAVAPLLSGAGVKGKVNQAMQLGVPVVATSIAAEGVRAEEGREILIADKAEAFADKVVAAYTNCTLWAQLVEGGRSNLQQHFSLEAARGPLLEALALAGVPPQRTAGPEACSRQDSTVDE